MIPNDPFATQQLAIVRQSMPAPATNKLGNGKINLDEFDEEINGINLSKLFSAYGPPLSSNLNHKAPIPVQGGGHNIQGNMGESEKDEYGEEDDEDDNPDFTSFDEPIVVRLMANMFSSKKSVQEGIQMLPEISLDKIRREIEYMKA